MLRSIFKKTLYEKRWSILWWSLAMFAMTLFVVVLFPTFKDTFGQTLDNVPDSLKQVLGSANDYQRIEGYLHIQVLMQMIFLTVIYSVIVFTGLVAGDESNGTLHTLLSQPVSRSKVYIQKLLAGGAMLWIVNFTIFVAVWLGCLLIGESLDYWKLFQAIIFLWLTTLTFGLVGYALGGATGKRGLAGALAGVYAFLAYLVSSLTTTVEWLKYPNYLSPIKYFSEPRVLDVGLQLNNTLVLVGAGVLLVAIGWIIFIKRDIYSK